MPSPSVVREPEPGRESAPAPTGARVASRTRLRSHIVEVSFRLFLERGYDTVTTQEIADACGITQRTLFRHFPRKDLIVAGGTIDYATIFEDFLARNIDRFDAPVDAVLAAVAHLSASYDSDRAAISTAYAIRQQSEYLRTVERANQLKIDGLAALALEGAEAFRAGCDPSLAARLVAALILAAVRTSIRAWLKGELPGTLRRYTDLNMIRLRPLVAAGEVYAQALTEDFAGVGAD